MPSRQINWPTAFGWYLTMSWDGTPIIPEIRMNNKKDNTSIFFWGGGGGKGSLVESQNGSLATLFVHLSSKTTTVSYHTWVRLLRTPQKTAVFVCCHFSSKLVVSTVQFHLAQAADQLQIRILL